MYHAAFSAIKYSQLCTLWKLHNNERLIEDKLAVCEIHKYHDHLMPYFQTNECFEVHIEKELKEEQQRNDSSDRLQCLKEKQLQKKTVDETDLLYELPLVACDWNEDYWNLRLFHSIKAAFTDLCIRFTAHKGLDFSVLQSELSSRVPLSTL